MQISPAIPSAFSTIWRASRSELSSSALAAACANGPPEPIAIRPCSGSSTSPLPEISSDASLSATASMASSRPSRRSVRHSLASSTAARVSWPLWVANLSSNSSNSVKASAVAPAKPASTSEFLPSRRILRALALTTVLPSVTWPSPPRTTLPFLRTDRMVVAWKDSMALSLSGMPQRWGWPPQIASKGVRPSPADAGLCRTARQWPKTFALQEIYASSIVKSQLAVRGTRSRGGTRHRRVFHAGESSGTRCTRLHCSISAGRVHEPQNETPVARGARRPDGWSCRSRRLGPGTTDATRSGQHEGSAQDAADGGGHWIFDPARGYRNRQPGDHHRSPEHHQLRQA